MIKTMLVVALGGGVGSALRYAVSRLISENVAWTFPLATLAVNVAGCLLIGFFYGLSARGGLGGDTTKALLTTGLCGGFTTFSTFCNEGLALLNGDATAMALIYAAGSVMAGLVAVSVGYMAATALG